MQLIKLISVPAKYEILWPHFINFQVLDWEQDSPVIAFLGSRTALTADAGWGWEFDHQADDSGW